mmetsp:Transcript_106089/g.330912  ORF Transcript_106089/g.330912 Transcript_106089/m.330912 type:complete len:463 (+) Transcript_106089:87-1475(+)
MAHRFASAGATSVPPDASSLQSRAVMLAQDVLRLHEEYESRLTQYRGQISDLSSQVEKANTQYSLLEQELRGYRQQAGSKPSARERELESANAELTAQVQKAEQACAPAQVRVVELEREVAELKRRLEEHETREPADDERVGELEKEAGQLERQVQSIADSDGGCILDVSGDNIFLQEKGQFLKFVLGVANGGKDSKEYKQMYNFLLKCFTDADNNFDGRVGYLEFDTLIDAAAFLPRRFGYAPTTPELYSSDFDRVSRRLQVFNSLKPRKAQALDGKSGTYDYISFDVWLQYAITHIKEKAQLLTNETSHSQLGGTPAEFKMFIDKACRSRKSQEYKELYHYVLKRFTEADSDQDGLIDWAGFRKLVVADAYPPGLQGFAPFYDTDGSTTVDTTKEEEEACSKVFRKLDSTNAGRIRFDTWLEYLFTHICQKVIPAGSDGAVPDVGAAGTSKAEPRCPWRV